VIEFVDRDSYDAYVKHPKRRPGTSITASGSKPIDYRKLISVLVT
jgi:hypothetical protein